MYRSTINASNDSLFLTEPLAKSKIQLSFRVSNFLLFAAGTQRARINFAFFCLLTASLGYFDMLVVERFVDSCVMPPMLRRFRDPWLR